MLIKYFIDESVFFKMIIGDIYINKDQLVLDNKSYVSKIQELINETDFSKVDDGVYEIDGDNFFYLLTTYQTESFSAHKKAEVHMKYTDLQYILYGEELIGYGGTMTLMLPSIDYDEKKDIEYLNHVADESFFILKKDKFALFYPYEIHRPGIINQEKRSVRKIVFKIKN